MVWSDNPTILRNPDAILKVVTATGVCQAHLLKLDYRSWSKNEDAQVL